MAIYICALFIPSPELRKYTGERGLWSWCLKSTFNDVSRFIVFTATFKNDFSFIGGGNRSFGENYTLIASPLQTLYWEHLSWAWFQLTTVMGIGTDCIVSCTSNYHSITTAPKLCNTVSIKQKYTIYMQRNWKIKASLMTTFYWYCPPVHISPLMIFGRVTLVH